MEKKKIAILLPSFEFGGAETMVAQLVNQINKEKFDVYLILKKEIKKNALFDSILDKKIKIFSINNNSKFNVKSIIQMYKLLKNIKPAIIHTHLHTYPYVLLYSFLHRIKILHTIHNTPSMESKKIGQRILKILFKLNIAVPVGISDTITSQIKDHYKVKNVETIYNPVNILKFYNVKKVKSSNFTFINVGRMTEQKNQKLLIKTFSNLLIKYPFCRLIICGDGALKEELKSLAKDKGIMDKINFTGNVSNIEDYYSASHVFILSSIYEGLPMTALEAMSSSLPLILTDVGGNKDLIKENGFLINSNSEEELYKAMEYMIINEEQRVLFANNSLSESKKYDIKVITKKYEELYIKYEKKNSLK